MDEIDRDGGAAAIREWLNELRGRDLTDREVEVLEGLGHGRSSKDIAASLGIDAGTVETYRSRMRTKLKLRDGSELLRAAIAWAHQN